jgi:hypothetical protein
MTAIFCRKFPFQNGVIIHRWLGITYAGFFAALNRERLHAFAYYAQYREPFQIKAVAVKDLVAGD